MKSKTILSGTIPILAMVVVSALYLIMQPMPAVLSQISPETTRNRIVSLLGSAEVSGQEAVWREPVAGGSWTLAAEFGFDGKPSTYTITKHYGPRILGLSQVVEEYTRACPWPGAGS